MSLITRDLLGNQHSSKQSKLPNLKSEKDYLQICRSTNTTRATDQNASNLQDLNQPPSTLLDDTNLDLKLVSNLWASSHEPYTLGKVKFALERAEKEDAKKRAISMPFIEANLDDEAYASGCPSCLLYVLISSRNPKCPRCNMTILPSTSPTTMKKPRIDLN